MLGKLAKIAKCQKSNGYNFAIVEMAAEARVTVAYKLDDSDELFHASLDEKATVANLLEKIRNEKARPDLRLTRGKKGDTIKFRRHTILMYLKECGCASEVGH